MSTARLELVVTSSGIQSADKDLKQLTATSKETEKQQQHMAAIFAEVAAAEEKAAAKAVAAAEKQAAAAEKAAARAAAAAEKQAQQAATAAERQAAVAARQAAREAEAWNDAKQKAIARYEKQAEAAERAAARQVAAAEKATKHENEMWNNAIQRAKAGLDGVLPIRPSLQRIEAKINEPRSEGGAAGIFAGGKEGAVSALGLGALAGGAAAVAAKAVETVIESVKGLSAAVIENLIQDDKLVARLGGVTDSAEAAGEVFEDLQKQTFGKLPSKLDEVANAFIQLGNHGLENGQSTLKAYSNIAAQTGTSLTGVASAVQSAAQGNYKALREFGVKIKEEGGDLQVTFRGQTQTIGDNVSAIEAYMQHLGSVEFAGAVERQMETIGGTVKKTEDAWEKFINAVGDSSLGSLIQSGVGASIGVIDALTASVEALFDKAHKGALELEKDKKAIAAQDKLDATMASWADPSASRSEIQSVADDIRKGREREPDKLLSHFTRIDRQLDKFEKLGETMVGDMTIAEARKENESNYRRAAGETKAKTEVPYNLDNVETNYTRYRDMRAKQDAEELRAVREALTKQEDAERVSYETRRAFLADYTGPDSEELWAKNSELWSKHLDEVALKSAKAQLELQKRLQNIGLGPQSQAQLINNKFAGQRIDLESALADNLSGKNGEALKLEAEQTYAQKSIEIEKARAREIAQVNRDLVQQSAQNAEMIFGGLAAAMKNAHGEQSKEYRMMFAAQKAFAIATAEVAMFTDMAKANEAGFPANVPLYLKAAADGAQIIAQLSSLSYAGAYDSGGQIGEGSYGDVGERRPELLLVHGKSQVQGPATVIGGQATARLLGGGQAERPIRFVTVVGATDAFKGFLGSTPHEEAMVNFVKNNGPLIRSVVR